MDHQVRTPGAVGSNGHPTSDADELRSQLRTERAVNALTTAVFGNPYDHEDHGMIGEIRQIRTSVTDKLTRIYFAVLGLAGAVLSAAVVIAVSLH